MRELSVEELDLVVRAMKRRAAAEHYRTLRSALAGQNALVSAMITAVEDLPDVSRRRLEPRLLERKAELLRAEVPLPVLERFFSDAAAQLITPLLEGP
jgi:hypothetical protein